MRESTTEKIKRLPQWAQRHIAVLNSNIAHHKEQAQAAMGQRVSGAYVVLSYGRLSNGWAEDRAYIESESVVFNLTEDPTAEAHGRQVRVKIERDSRGPHLQVMWTGSGRMSVQPESGNVVSIFGPAPPGR